MSKIQDVFVERVLEIMKKRDISQYKLSEDSGLSSASISRFLSKKIIPTLDSVQAVADGLGVEAKDLLGEQDISFIPPHVLKLMKGQDEAFFDAVEAVAKAFLIKAERERR